MTGYEILRAPGACAMTPLVADTGNQRVSYLDEDATVRGETYAYRVKTIMGARKSEGSNRVRIQLGGGGGRGHILTRRTRPLRLGGPRWLRHRVELDHTAGETPTP